MYEYEWDAVGDIFIILCHQFLLVLVKAKITTATASAFQNHNPKYKGFQLIKNILKLCDLSIIKSN